MNEITRISEEIIEHLNKNDVQKRKHANFWNFHKKTSKELGIFSEIFEQFQQDSGFPIVNWGLCDTDPPDIFAKLSDGSLIGIEITELVNESAIKAQINNQNDYYEELLRFDFETAVNKLNAILLEKEEKLLLNKSKYNELSLLIHTDEWLLKSEQFVDKGHEIFPKNSEIFQKVYLLFSYESDKKKCPLIRLVWNYRLIGETY